MKLIGLIVCSVLATASGENGPRIINGEAATTQDVPYIAHLFSVRRKQFVCGASIIDKNWALTAAHCVMSDEKYVLQINKGDKKTQKFVRVEKAVLHPDFERQFKILGTEPNDIALLKLGDNDVIQDSNIIKPAPTDVGDLEEQECTMTGWGLNSPMFLRPKGRPSPYLVQRKLRAALRDLRRRQQVQNALDAKDNGAEVDVVRRKFPNWPDAFGRKEFDRMIKKYKLKMQGRGQLHQTTGVIRQQQCTQDYEIFDETTQLCLHNNVSGGCKGDSGGPLVCGGYLAGVTSMVQTRCNPKFPTMFTKVSAYYDWISSTTNITFETEEAAPQEETPEEAPLLVREEIPDVEEITLQALESLFSDLELEVEA